MFILKWSKWSINYLDRKTVSSRNLKNHRASKDELGSWEEWVLMSQKPFCLCSGCSSSPPSQPDSWVLIKKHDFGWVPSFQLAFMWDWPKSWTCLSSRQGLLYVQTLAAACPHRLQLLADFHCCTCLLSWPLLGKRGFLPLSHLPPNSCCVFS